MTVAVEEVILAEHAIAVVVVTVEEEELINDDIQPQMKTPASPEEDFILSNTWDSQYLRDAFQKVMPSFPLKEEDDIGTRSRK